MSRKKIVHLITRLEPGGSTANTLDSCAAQSKVYDVILMYGPHPAAAGLLKGLPPEVNCIEVPELQRELDPLRDLRAYQTLKKDFRRLAPDLVHTHTSKAGALGRLAARGARNAAGGRTAVVHTAHGHLLYGYYGRLKTRLFAAVEARLARHTDRLIALTPTEMRECLAAGIGSEPQWYVVHSGVHLAPPLKPLSKADLGLHPEDTVAGCIARLEPVKGVETLVRAAAALREKIMGVNPKLVVVGGGELERPLRKLAYDLGVDTMMVFTGWRDDAQALLGAFDFYVQPSLNEGMGRAPLEAQAAGLPVIVSRACGLPDIVQEEKTGLCVPPGDPAALARAIERLMIAPKVRARLGAAAREWALSKNEHGEASFGPEAMNRRLLRIYAGLLK